MARAARAVGPRLARCARSAAPRVGRFARTATPRTLRGVGPRTWRYPVGALAAGLALATAAATAAGPWDSTGQRTAERHRAVTLGGVRGTDHGGVAADPGAGAGLPRPAISADPVLRALGRTTGGKQARTGPGVSDLLERLLSDPALGSRQTASVVDLTTGERLYGTGLDTPLTPASTTKIATAVAALAALGPDHRLTTRAVLEPEGDGLVLVGGGDPTLTARPGRRGLADLRTLADRTAEALLDRDLRKVALSYDASLYAGDAEHPIGVNDNLAEVTALMVDEARTDDSVSGPVHRVPDPAEQATLAFAALLAERGVETTSPSESRATKRAVTLASVSSPPLSTLVERMMTHSDNDLAEALARHTALASGKRADFAGASAAIERRLGELGVALEGVRVRDGSGLDRSGRVTARALTDLLVVAADPARPDLRPALTGLPVAGFTGTLAGRYADAGAGVVRAKTGTLSGVDTLSGTVVTRDGRALAFAFLADGTANAAEARTALDSLVTALADCGCR
ncbi:D-alanyl-D-alanine carboxypeptidase/D-alanyl-D-alanine-endopeptidase [Streptomyces sp. HSG2]|uniref:D-alanyl-D-alanine carboxypeptidase/D-alanyl-D-alanine endopeptidase n=1 Tax=Streptomyces sp. HSG2 TaxID=2797167 RepID=UPI00190517D4|nr:D-alanyl-D-alanine carboxypeptidase/D-alanyl-D-alanine-endopeptidase [Streptomyces sp. HSG2]